MTSFVEMVGRTSPTGGAVEWHLVEVCGVDQLIRATFVPAIIQNSLSNLDPLLHLDVSLRSVPRAGRGGMNAMRVEKRMIVGDRTIMKERRNGGKKRRAAPGSLYL